MAAADRYAEILTDADVATLKHLADTGMGANTLRALAYHEAEFHAATGTLCRGWPIPNFSCNSLRIFCVV